EIDLAWALVEKGIDEVGYVLSEARTVEEAVANPELITALEALVGSTETGEHSVTDDHGSVSHNHNLVYNTLTSELENSFVVLEELELDTPAEVTEPLLKGFADECLFLAETLELPWLATATTPIIQALAESEIAEVLLLTKDIIAQLRSDIAVYVNQLELNAVKSQETANQNQDLVVNTLNQDLEAICQAIADLAFDTPEAVINEALTGFLDECTFLGETLELPWLIEVVAPISTIIAEADPFEALLTVQELIGEIRQQRAIYLDSLEAATDIEAIAFNEVEQEIDGMETEQLNVTAGFFDLENEDMELSTVMFAPPAVSESKIISKIVEESQKSTANQVKIPLERLENMTNNVEELILSHSRFNRQQQLLNQANRRLRSLTRQFEPIREQIENLYNQLAVASTNLAAKTEDDEDFIEDDNYFDSLEMDRYTDLHTSLQSFQELMLQIQETRTDLDFVDRELAEDIEQTEKNLGTLYTQVTDSRLVPFDLLAKRFVPQIKGLSQRFD
ncbi:MAG: hybrid sensor histidine kinase/response regulator, partial [Waterburya sp.]